MLILTRMTIVPHLEERLNTTLLSIGVYDKQALWLGILRFLEEFPPRIWGRGNIL
jgi:hypothetical protein